MTRNFPNFTLVLLALYVVTISAEVRYNPCCEFPCENRAVCVATKNYEDYTCDCEGTGLSYYGKNCSIPTMGQWLFNLMVPNYDALTYVLTSFKPLWWLIERVSFVKKRIMSEFIIFKTTFVDSPPLYATNDHDYTILDSARNRTFFARALPPVPENCPKPLGVYGKDELPSLDLVIEKLFRRKEFVPDRVGTSLLLAFMAQHFTHQFFKTDFKTGPGHTFGAQSVDGSHIYGNTRAVEDALRSQKNGKMKMQVLNGEEYPPYLKDVNLNITLPNGFPVPQDVDLFALGHDFFTLLPGLFLYNTIYLREHNRVCDILKADHPEWDDERLFQTAKLVVLGVSIKVIIEDYLQAVSNYYLQIEFDPTLIHGKPFNFVNRVSVEHNHLYYWHQMIPDEFNIDGTTYNMEEFLFHCDLVVEHGTKKFTESLSKQVAGAITLQNHGFYTLGIAKEAIHHGRQLKMQPYNQYLKRFGPKPLTSIDQMTDNKEHVKLLKELYGDDVNGIEFYVGMMAEQRRREGIFGPGMYEIIGPYSLKGLFSAPICTEHFWRPSTFGGETGFNIVKTASLRKLFQQNMPNADSAFVSFRVAEDNPESNLGRVEL